MDPRVSLASAYLTFNLAFGPNSPPPSVDFGVHPKIYTGDSTLAGLGPLSIESGGQASPLGYWYSDRAIDPRNTHKEELAHIDQMEALGPAFYLAYALTGGEPFEPYRSRQGDYTMNYDRMWDPKTAGMERNFPQFRATLGDSPSVEFLPGYGDLLSLAWEALRGFGTVRETPIR